MIREMLFAVSTNRGSSCPGRSPGRCGYLSRPSAVQLHELIAMAGGAILPFFALQARGRWFEPSCAHQVLQLDGLFKTPIGGPLTTAGNHRCMLSDGRRCPVGHGSIPPSSTRASRARRQALPALGASVSRCGRMRMYGHPGSGRAGSWLGTPESRIWAAHEGGARPPGYHRTAMVARAAHG